MNRTAPPTLATWILEHWAPGDSNDALAGDLLEEFSNGRSGAWYWRQVLAAIAIGCTREILNRRTVLLFAGAWSMLGPAWSVLSWKSETQSRAFGMMWQMDFPWSMICSIGLTLATSLAFIWAGMIVYQLSETAITRSFCMRRLGRGLLISVPVLIVLSAALMALSLILHPKHGRGIDLRALTPLKALVDLRAWAMVQRLFNLPTLIWALWRMGSRPRGGNKRIAA